MKRIERWEMRSGIGHAARSTSDTNDVKRHTNKHTSIELRLLCAPVVPWVWSGAVADVTYGRCNIESLLIFLFRLSK